VRESGSWAQSKLAFIDHFVPTAIDATQSKVRRVYVDLFAGPGMNADKERPEKEFVGGALRVLQMTGRKRTDLAFTDAVLVNVDQSDHQALTARIDRLEAEHRLIVPRESIITLHADANSSIPRIMSRFDKLDYLLIFADPEAPRQWPWKSVEALKEGGHQSVDLYCLLPIEMGLRRLLNFRGPVKRTDYEAAFDAFFGCTEWRAIVERRPTKAQSQQMGRELEELYLKQLRGLWKYADHIVTVRRRQKQGLYRMVFASSHPAGRDIATWAKKVTEELDQPRLGRF
jgi:three-Cys-motif partner protein